MSKEKKKACEVHTDFNRQYLYSAHKFRARDHAYQAAEKMYHPVFRGNPLIVIYIFSVHKSKRDRFRNGTEIGLDFVIRAISHERNVSKTKLRKIKNKL